VLTIDEVARRLNLLRREGEPNRRAVHELIRNGKLRIVDADTPVQRWTMTSAEGERYPQA
jgi:hypothetical protein